MKSRSSPGMEGAPSGAPDRSVEDDVVRDAFAEVHALRHDTEVAYERFARRVAAGEAGGVWIAVLQLFDTLATTLEWRLEEVAR